VYSQSEGDPDIIMSSEHVAGQISVPYLRQAQFWHAECHNDETPMVAMTDGSIREARCQKQVRKQAAVYLPAAQMEPWSDGRIPLGL